MRTKTTHGAPFVEVCRDYDARRLRGWHLARTRSSSPPQGHLHPTAPLPSPRPDREGGRRFQDAGQARQGGRARQDAFRQREVHRLRADRRRVRQAAQEDPQGARQEQGRAQAGAALPRGQGLVPAKKVKVKSVRTVEGSKVRIKVRKGTVYLNGRTKVTAADVRASNGIIHVINKVLIPEGPRALARDRLAPPSPAQQGELGRDRPPRPRRSRLRPALAGRVPPARSPDAGVEARRSRPPAARC